MRLFYLNKREITVRTDSAAIERFYNKSAEHKPSEIRWIRFMDYITGAGPHIIIEHIKGKHNGLADLLSRLKVKLAESPTEEQVLLAKAVREIISYPEHPQAQQLIEWGNKIVGPFPTFKRDKFERTESAFVLTQEPVLMCACRKPAVLFTSGTRNNPSRKFYKCVANQCHCWYWKDLIEAYVQDRIEEFMVDNFDSKMNISEASTSQAKPEIEEDPLENLRSSVIDRPRPSDEHFKPGYEYPQCPEYVQEELANRLMTYEEYLKMIQSEEHLHQQNSLQKIAEDYPSPPWGELDLYCHEDPDLVYEDARTEDLLDLEDVIDDIRS
jgi:hypothetical protein